MQKKNSETIVKRSGRGVIGLFIDGTQLDRAARRLQKRVSLEALLKSFQQSHTVKVARYYTVLPQEDDSRHRSFLDAVSRAGFEVVVKRLPPKNVERQVSSDIELTTDMFVFVAAHEGDKDLPPEIIVVCPSRDLSYPFTALKERGIKTTSADFSAAKPGDVLKSAENWVDLTDADIWMK